MYRIQPSLKVEASNRISAVEREETVHAARQGMGDAVAFALKEPHRLKQEVETSHPELPTTCQQYREQG